jgi:hypothetical protein
LYDEEAVLTAKEELERKPCRRIFKVSVYFCVLSQSSPDFAAEGFFLASTPRLSTA